MNLNTEQYFSEIPQIHAPRSVFDRSFTHKTTMDVNKLYPIFIDECLPGDSMKLKFQVFGRLANPLIVPIIDELYFETLWFKSPMRLLWNNSFKFFGERENPDDSNDYVIPTISSGSTGFAVGSVFDHFGIKPLTPYLEVNALPFRFLNRAYNEWLRDQNLVNSVPVPLGDTDDASNYTLLTSSKMHDLFTSALPTTQLGDAVTIPFGNTAPVYGDGTQLRLTSSGNSSDIASLISRNDPFRLEPNTGNGRDHSLPYVYPAVGSTVTSNSCFGLVTKSIVDSINSDSTHGSYPTSSGVYADLSSATGINVNDLRFLIKCQQYRERLLTGGHRYREIVSQFFNVDQLDNRAYTTEFLGMTREMIDINTVVQTSSTDSVSPLGHLSAYGVVNSFESGFSTSCVEHSYILGLARIRHNPVYQQGLNKLWSRSVQLDFYNPMFNGLGEQPILNKEIMVQGSAVVDATTGDAIDDMTFGFNEAWYEYRYYPSLITGQLRSGIPNSLDCYHLAQYFGTSSVKNPGTSSMTVIHTETLPLLNQSFIEENIPINRALAVTSNEADGTPQFIMDFRFTYECAREIPVKNIPAGMYSGI